jgi:hypothetical protein
MAVTGRTSDTPPNLVVCFCCGQLFMDDDLTRFEQHPDQGVCARCAAWLHSGGGRPVPPKSRGRVWRRHGRRRWRRE